MRTMNEQSNSLAAKHTYLPYSQSVQMVLATSDTSRRQSRCIRVYISLAGGRPSIIGTSGRRSLSVYIACMPIAGTIDLSLNQSRQFDCTHWLTGDQRDQLKNYNYSEQFPIEFTRTEFDSFNEQFNNFARQQIYDL